MGIRAAVNLRPFSPMCAWFEFQMNGNLFSILSKVGIFLPPTYSIDNECHLFRCGCLFECIRLAFKPKRCSSKHTHTHTQTYAVMMMMMMRYHKNIFGWMLFSIVLSLRMRLLSPHISYKSIYRVFRLSQAIIIENDMKWKIQFEEIQSHVQSWIKPKNCVSIETKIEKMLNYLEICPRRYENVWWKVFHAEWNWKAKTKTKTDEMENFYSQKHDRIDELEAPGSINKIWLKLK